LVTIAAPRQSGKTSFLARLSDTLRKNGRTVAQLDLRIDIGLPDSSNRRPADWFRLLFEAMAERLDLDSSKVAEWLAAHQSLPPVRQVIDFVSEFCAERISGPFVIVIDELDFISLFGNYTDHFLEGLRKLAEQETIEVTFILASLIHPSELYKTLPPAAFNVFHAEPLEDFVVDADTVSRWSAGLPWGEEVRHRVGREVLKQTGGQPYLSSVIFQAVLDAKVSKIGDVRELIQKLARVRDNPQLKAHIRNPQDILLHNQSRAWRALDLYRKILDGPVSTSGSHVRAVNLLKTTGLVREHEGHLVMRSPIYKHIFDTAWVDECKAEIGATSFQLKSPVANHAESSDTICVINTGGMISMELKDDGRIDEPDDLREFFRDFPEMQQIANVETLALMCKDGTNMNPTDWKAIAEAIYQRRDRGYRGFVVCHGTDTLAYSASAVAFALGPGLKIPVVFTGAQTPRHILHGDARINLLRACKIATLDLPEVVICIGDDVYRAVRAEKRDDYRFDAFHSPTMPPLATVAHEIELQKDLRRTPKSDREMECLADFSDGVFKVTFYPGLNPAFLDVILDSAPLTGLIIETPGVGVLPTEGTYSLMGLVEKAIAKAIPVLLVSQYPIQSRFSEVYQLASLPIQAGAIPAVNMSAPAAITKFMWVLPQIEREMREGKTLPGDKLKRVKEYMNDNIVGELSE
jgi:L-asparaginase